MKNLQYFPFERNRYYYGKLLTEQDFNSEQRYFNDKRRMVNRFLHGSGVAAGLTVAGIDEKSISLEAGLALDGAGREIVAERPAVVRLEQLDGFSRLSEEKNRDFVYLCIEYDEKETMPSHSIASGPETRDGGTEFDKCREGYRLYLTDRPLEDTSDTLDAMFHKRTILYEDEGICITQQYPRFIKSGEEFELRLIIENRGSAKEVSLELEETLTCASFRGENRFRAAVKERMETRDSVKEYAYILNAFPVEMGDAEFSMSAEQFRLKCGGKSQKLSRELFTAVPVVKKDAYQMLKEQHYREAMDHVLKNAYPPGIYLAKIWLIQTGHVYMIDRVEPMPFDQYVYTPFLTMGMLKALLAEREKEAGARGPSREIPVNPEGKEKEERRAQGTVELQLGIGGKRGQKFFSHEIVHGLGLGEVSIALALEGEKEMLFGSSEIFEDDTPKAELAAKADISRGSFVIGLRLLEPTGQQTIRVHWTAVMGKQDRVGTLGEPRLTIRPSKLEMRVRETYYLEAAAENLPGAQILWEVRSREGGFISRDGMYTAPNQPGVYEIQAWCQEMPKLRASLYVIVRE